MKTNFLYCRQFIGGLASLSAVGWEISTDANGLPNGKFKLAWKGSHITLHSDVREGSSRGFLDKMVALVDALDDIITNLSSDEYWVFRMWLNADNSPFTGSIAAEVDLPRDFAVVEIADCTGKVRLYRSEFGVDEPIEKMKYTLLAIRESAKDAARGFESLLQMTQRG